jgi:hypothetical protein
MADRKHFRDLFVIMVYQRDPPFNFVTTGSDLQLKLTTLTNDATLKYFDS